MDASSLLFPGDDVPSFRRATTSLALRENGREFLINLHSRIAIAKEQGSWAPRLA